MTTPSAASQTRDYAALMQCSAGDHWLPEATSQVSAWLRKKNIDADLSGWGDHEFGPGVRLAVRPMPLDHGMDLWLRLEEDRGPNDRWTTEILLHDERGDRDWIQLAVRNDGDRFVDVPNLARYLIQMLPLNDSRIEFSDHPQQFGHGDVDRLVELLEDQSRHGLVFVAGSSNETIPFDAFATQVGKWAKQVSGLAQVIVLDPSATTVFESRVGRTFATPAWTIRTYQPGVHFGDRFDARRHRILGTSRLANQSDRAITYLLGDIARAQAATRPADPSVLRVRRRLLRLENSRLVDAIAAADVAAPPPKGVDALGSPEIEAPEIGTRAKPNPAESQVALVRRILRIKEVTEESLTGLARRLFKSDSEAHALVALKDRLDTLQTAVEEAEDEKQSLVDALSEAQTEAEVARLDVDDLGDRIRWLESRLKSEGDYEASYLDIPEEFRSSRPGSFPELLARLPECPGVEFTGDTAEVEKLNQIDTTEAALRTAWDAIMAMSGYVRARSEGACNKGLADYLENTPTDYPSFPPGKFGESETGMTMRSFGSEREFSVPEHVDPSGFVTMKAHFKLARIGMVSPRMYVFDGHPTHNRVYIGYIGPHLTNTKTN